MADDIRTKLTKARIALLIHQPFFGSILLRLEMVETDDPDIPTMGVDGVHLFYNREFVASVTFDELVGLLAHEPMHVACLHHLRQGSRNHDKWNRACDYAINPIIEEAHLRLPRTRLRKQEYDGMSAEAIYSHLPDEKDDGKGKGGSQGPGKGKGDFGRCGQVLPFPQGDDPSAVAEQEQQVKIAVTQAAQYAKACGKFPKGLEKVIGDLLAPKVDWREPLKRFVQAIARNDYTFRRPNPRYIATGFYLPTLYNERLGHVYFILDTSGSLTDKEILDGASELDGILQEYPGTHLTVVYADASVQHVDEFEGDAPVKLTRHGGGGTNFRPAFEWIGKQDERPACAIYMTDGECNSFPEIPDYPVMWLATKNFNPPFGDIIPLRQVFEH